MIIDGKTVKQDKILQLKSELENLQPMPCLCVVQVGEDEASKVYVKQKVIFNHFFLFILYLFYICYNKIRW